MDSILHNLDLINDRVRKACLKSGRNPEDIRVLLATKTVPPERIKIAIGAGFSLIGENKVQEVKEKYEELKAVAHESHFIGHLQTNKIKDIIRYGVSCVQSLDRLDLAEKLSARLEREGKTMNVLIQVNTSEEESKFGVEPEKALDLIKSIAQLEYLKIRGLMTIGLFSAEEAKVRPCFKLLKDISEQAKALNLPNVQMNELSMGMSGDLEIAIEEGATIIRIGTAIFGPRQYPDSYYWNENK